MDAGVGIYTEGGINGRSTPHHCQSCEVSAGFYDRNTRRRDQAEIRVEKDGGISANCDCTNGNKSECIVGDVWIRSGDFGTAPFTGSTFGKACVVCLAPRTS